MEPLIREYRDTLEQLLALRQQKERERQRNEKEIRILDEEIADVHYALRLMERR